MEVSLQEGIVLCPNVKGKGSCLKIFLHLLIKLLAISFCILNPLFEAISGRSETDTSVGGRTIRGKKPFILLTFHIIKSLQKQNVYGLYSQWEQSKNNNICGLQIFESHFF